MEGILLAQNRLLTFYLLQSLLETSHMLGLACIHGDDLTWSRKWTSHV